MVMLLVAIRFIVIDILKEILNQENFQRELKGLKKTMEKFKIKTGCIVYYETDIKFSKIKDVEILNVFEFYRKYIKN